jgi:hypothetical protein
MRLALWLLVCCAADCAAATASGRNWRIDLHQLSCEASQLTIGMRIAYLGPKGPVEAPVSRLAEVGGKRYLPRSLVWTRGSKQHAEWLVRGGLSNVQSEEIGEFQLKFEVGEASGELQLEFGDIRGFALTRGGKGACAGVLKPDQLKMPRASRAAAANERIRIYRGAYPCFDEGLKTTQARHPPYLPRQLLVFGRGYLPSAREIELPIGRAPAQSYAYSGPDDAKGIEQAVHRSLASDFPALVKAGNFGFDWGLQVGATGNELWSIGIYELKACPK